MDRPTITIRFEGHGRDGHPACAASSQQLHVPEGAERWSELDMAAWFYAQVLSGAYYVPSELLGWVRSQQPAP